MKASDLLHAMNALPPEAAADAAPKQIPDCKPDISGVLNAIRGDSDVPITVSRKRSRFGKILPIAVTLTSAAACIALVGGIMRSAKKENLSTAQNSEITEIEAVQTTTAPDHTEAETTCTEAETVILTDSSGSEYVEVIHLPAQKVDFSAEQTVPQITKKGETVIHDNGTYLTTVTTARPRSATASTTTTDAAPAYTYPQDAYSFMLHVPNDSYDSSMHLLSGTEWLSQKWAAPQRAADFPPNQQQAAGYQYLKAHINDYDIIWVQVKADLNGNVPQVAGVEVNSDGQMTLIGGMCPAADRDALFLYEDALWRLVIPVPKGTLSRVSGWKLVTTTPQYGEMRVGVPQFYISRGALTLDTLKALHAEKGEHLNCLDFLEYDHTVEDCDTYIYPLEAPWQLVMTRSDMNSRTEFLRLRWNAGSGVEIRDLTPEALQDYIENRTIMLRDVISLEALDKGIEWRDLTPYACTDIGSGVSILEFRIADAPNYRLLAFGAEMEGNSPSRLILEYQPDGSRYSFRLPGDEPHTGSVVDFLDEHGR